MTTIIIIMALFILLMSSSMLGLCFSVIPFSGFSLRLMKSTSAAGLFCCGSGLDYIIGATFLFLNNSIAQLLGIRKFYGV